MAGMGFGGLDLAEAIAIIENENKKTLGQVLTLLRERVKLSDGWADNLTRGLDARNRFVHLTLCGNERTRTGPRRREAWWSVWPLNSVARHLVARSSS